jgi:hypothetical protein
VVQVTVTIVLRYERSAVVQFVRYVTVATPCWSLYMSPPHVDVTARCLLDENLRAPNAAPTKPTCSYERLKVFPVESHDECLNDVLTPTHWFTRFNSGLLTHHCRIKVDATQSPTVCSPPHATFWQEWVVEDVIAMRRTYKTQKKRRKNVHQEFALIEMYVVLPQKFASLCVLRVSVCFMCNMSLCVGCWTIVLHGNIVQHSPTASFPISLFLSRLSALSLCCFCAARMRVSPLCDDANRILPRDAPKKIK